MPLDCTRLGAKNWSKCPEGNVGRFVETDQTLQRKCAPKHLCRSKATTRIQTKRDHGAPLCASVQLHDSRMQRALGFLSSCARTNRQLQRRSLQGLQGMQARPGRGFKHPGQAHSGHGIALGRVAARRVQDVLAP